MRMFNKNYIGTASKLSSPGGKTSEWELLVRRVSDGKIVEGRTVWLTNNEFVADRAIAKARRLAAEFSE